MPSLLLSASKKAQLEKPETKEFYELCTKKKKASCPEKCSWENNDVS